MREGRALGLDNRKPLQEEANDRSLHLLASLAASSAVDLVAAALFALVGVALSRRAVDIHARSAARMFAAWWFALASVVAIGGFALNGGALGLAAAAWGPSAIPPSGLLAFLLAWTLVACVAVWGILGHLVYLFSGRHLGRALAWAYTALFVLFALIAWWERPVGLAASTLGVRVAYERPVTGPALVALLAFLELPQIASAIAYGALLRAAASRAARYRVAVVSGTLTTWFSLAFVTAALRVETQDAWIITLRFVGLASALLILAAYAPPRWVRARSERSRDEALREIESRRRKFRERVADLV